MSDNLENMLANLSPEERDQLLRALLGIQRGQSTGTTQGNSNVNRDNQGQSIGVNYGVIQMLLPGQHPPELEPPPSEPVEPFSSQQPVPSTLAERLEALAEHIKQQDEQRKQEQQDVLAAAERYQQLGGRVGLARGMQNTQVIQIEDELRKGLVRLLNDATQPLPVQERVRAGFLLGDLGDPRFPVTIEQWQAEAEQALSGDTSGYFCRVEPGTYIVGSSNDDPDARDNEKPQHTVTFDEPFWIARLPLTNAQWQEWVREAEGQPSYAANDSDLNHPNQPVVNVTWYMCRDFCRWLSEQTGLTIRLPSEAEWEAAARGGDARRYPWGDDWRDDHAATEEDLETRGTRWSTPVGCYPRGAAPGGALDVAGNVWEWTHTPWAENHDPPRSTERADDAARFTFKWGDCRDDRTLVRCAARFRIVPIDGGNDLGLRVLLSPRAST
jgi:formylglycine-generating enzyme required for sulfatase activity